MFWLPARAAISKLQTDAEGTGAHPDPVTFNQADTLLAGGVPSILLAAWYYNPCLSHPDAGQRRRAEGGGVAGADGHCNSGNYQPLNDR